MFSIGYGLGLAHAWHAWAQLGQKTLPVQLSLPGLGSVDVVWMSLIVLAIAFVVELVVLRLAWRAFSRQAQAEGNRRPIKYLFQSNDPTLLAVLLEDSIAVFGVLLAITGIGLTRLTGNGIWDPADARKVSPNADERVKKNLEEGKGFSIMGMQNKKGGGGAFQFASSNPMWRATLEILDFLPLVNVDYSGGIITTDWYNEGTSNESIKITVRFLTNEIRSDGLRIIVHKKKCSLQQQCTVKKISSKLEQELQVAILKKAALFEKEYTKGKRKRRERREIR